MGNGQFFDAQNPGDIFHPVPFERQTLRITMIFDRHANSTEAQEWCKKLLPL
jgi:hypothetical protein